MASLSGRQRRACGVELPFAAVDEDEMRQRTGRWRARPCRGCRPIIFLKLAAPRNPHLPTPDLRCWRETAPKAFDKCRAVVGRGCPLDRPALVASRRGLAVDEHGARDHSVLAAKVRNVERLEQPRRAVEPEPSLHRLERLDTATRGESTGEHGTHGRTAEAEAHWSVHCAGTLVECDGQHRSRGLRAAEPPQTFGREPRRVC